MVKFIREESEFVEIEIGKSNYTSNIHWEVAKMALLKNKKVFYTFNGSEFVMTPEEAKEIITLERVRDEILNLELKEKDWAKELLKSKKEKRELRRLLRFLEEKNLKNSPK